MSGIRNLCAAAIALCLATAANASSKSTDTYVESNWFRTTDELPIQINHTVTEEWLPAVEAASVEWNKSDRINSPLLFGFSNVDKCSGISGTIQICSAPYGTNGWLGIARIVISGDHIAYGVAKLNDTYFVNAEYNESNWRQWILCRQLGHIYGLTLQNNAQFDQQQSSCMQGKAQGPEQTKPNISDFSALTKQYAEPDAFAKNIGISLRDSAAGLNESEIIEQPKYWGNVVHYDAAGRPDIYEKLVTPSRKVTTMVIWAKDAKKPARH
jgi:hypothetical protein